MIWRTCCDVILVPAPAHPPRHTMSSIKVYLRIIVVCNYQWTSKRCLQYLLTVRIKRNSLQQEDAYKLLHLTVDHMKEFAWFMQKDSKCYLYLIQSDTWLMTGEERYGPHGVQSGRYSGIWVNRTLGFGLDSEIAQLLFTWHHL